MSDKDQSSRWEVAKDGAEQLAKLPDSFKKIGDSIVGMGRKADAADHQLRQLANFAFPERDLAGRQQGAAQLDKLIISAGGNRDDATAALKTLLQGGVKIDDAGKLLPQLVDGGQVLGISADKLAQAAVAQQDNKDKGKDDADKPKQPPDGDKIQKNLRLAMAEAAANPGAYKPDEVDKWLPQLMEKVAKGGVSQDSLNRYDTSAKLMRDSAQFKDASQQSAQATSEANQFASRIGGDMKATYSELVAPVLDCTSAFLTLGATLAGLVTIIDKIKGSPEVTSPPSGGSSGSSQRSSKKKKEKNKGARGDRKPAATKPTAHQPSSRPASGRLSKLGARTRDIGQAVWQRVSVTSTGLQAIEGQPPHKLQVSGSTASKVLQKSGSLFKGGMRLAGRATGLVGLASGALDTYQMLSNPNATTGNKVRAVSGQLGAWGGSAIGGVIGGTLGALGGPVGIMLGAMAGRAVGSWLGGKVADKGGAMLERRIDSRQPRNGNPLPSRPIGAGTPPAVKPAVPASAVARPATKAPSPEQLAKGKNDNIAAVLLPQLQALVNQFAAAVTQLHSPLRVVVDVQNGNIVAAVNNANQLTARRN